MRKHLASVENKNKAGPDRKGGWKNNGAGVGTSHTLGKEMSHGHGIPGRIGTGTAGAPGKMARITLGKEMGGTQLLFREG